MSKRAARAARFSLKWFFLGCLGIGVALGLIGRHYVQKRLEKQRQERRLAAIPILNGEGHVEFRGDRVAKVHTREDKIDPRWSAALADVPDIEVLDVTYSGFSDDDARHLSGLRQAKGIIANRTDLTDAALVHLRNMHDLETLELRDTAITGTGFSHLAHLPRLRKVMLTGTVVDDSGLAALGRVTSLEELIVSGAPIRGSGLRYLTGLPRIRSLTLLMPTLDEVAGLEEFDQIGRLSLTGHGLCKRHIDQIAGMSGLLQLSLTTKRFDKPLLRELAHFGHLEYIQLFASQPFDESQPRIRWDDVDWLSQQLPNTDVEYHLVTDGMKLHPTRALAPLCNQQWSFRNGVESRFQTGRDDQIKARRTPSAHFAAEVRIQAVFSSRIESSAVSNVGSTAGD